MPSRRYTLRLPQALDATVQAYLQATGLPFADLMRDALHAYLADTPPTAQPTGPAREPTGEPTPADILSRLTDLTRRVDHLEQERTPSRQQHRHRTRPCARTPGAPG